MAISYKCLTTALSNNLPRTRIRRHMTTDSKPSLNIGIIGLDDMGTAMAMQLMRKGHKVHAYDSCTQATERVKNTAITLYKDVCEMICKPSFIITMLPNSKKLLSTYCGIAKVKKGTFFIDTSTNNPVVAMALGKIVKDAGSCFIDAPCSGGVYGATRGTLTFLVGGTDAEFKAAKEVLDDMGKDAIHCGRTGMGQAAKLCNILALATSMIGLAEAMNLGMRLGLEARIVAEAINKCSGSSWASKHYNPVPGICTKTPANSDYNGGYSLDSMTKDLTLAADMASVTDSTILMGSLAHQLYSIMSKNGLGCKDFGVIYEYIKGNNDKVP